MYTITDSSASAASASDQGNPDSKFSKNLCHLHEPQAAAFRDMTIIITTSTTSKNNSEDVVSDSQFPATSTTKVAPSPRLHSTRLFGVAHAHGDDDGEVTQQDNCGNMNIGYGTARQQHEQAGGSSLMLSSGKAVTPLLRLSTAPSRPTLAFSTRFNLRESGEISGRCTSLGMHPRGSSESAAVDLVGTVLSGQHESPISSISSHRFSETSTAPEGQFNNWLRESKNIRASTMGGTMGRVGRSPIVSKAVMELARARREREAIEESDSESTSSLSSDSGIDGGRGVVTNRLVRTPTISPKRSSTIVVNPRLSITTPEVAAKVLFPVGPPRTMKIPEREIGRRLGRICGDITHGDKVQEKRETSIGWDMMVRHGGSVAPEPGRRINKAVIELAKARREHEAIEESDSESSSSESSSSLSEPNNANDDHCGGGVATNEMEKTPTVSFSRPAIAVTPRLTIKAQETAGESLFPVSPQALAKKSDRDVRRRLSQIRGVADGDDDREKGKDATGWNGRVRHRGGNAPEPARSIHKVPIVGKPSASASTFMTKTMTPRGGKCGHEDLELFSSDQVPVESKAKPSEKTNTTPETMSAGRVQGGLASRRLATSGFHAEVRTGASSKSTLEKPVRSADGTETGRAGNTRRQSQTTPCPPGDRPQPEGKLEEQSGVQTHSPQQLTPVMGATNEERGAEEGPQSNYQLPGMSPIHSVYHDEKAPILSSNTERATTNQKSPSLARPLVPPVYAFPQRRANTTITMGLETLRSKPINARAGSAMIPDLYLSQVLQQNVVTFPVLHDAILSPSVLPLLAGGHHCNGNENDPMKVLNKARHNARRADGSGKSWASEPEAPLTSRAGAVRDPWRARILKEATAMLVNGGGGWKSAASLSTELTCSGDDGVCHDENWRNGKRELASSNCQPVELMDTRRDSPIVRNRWRVRILAETAETVDTGGGEWKSAADSCTGLTYGGDGGGCRNENWRHGKTSMVPSSWRPAALLGTKRAPVVRDPWCVRILVEAATTLASSVVVRSVAISPARTSSGILSSGGEGNNDRGKAVKRKCPDGSCGGSVSSPKSRKQCLFSATAHVGSSKNGIAAPNRWVFCGSCGAGSSSPQRLVSRGSNNNGKDSLGWGSKESLQIPLLTDFGSCGFGGSPPQQLMSRGRIRDHGKDSPGSDTKTNRAVPPLQGSPRRRHRGETTSEGESARPPGRTHPLDSMSARVSRAHLVDKGSVTGEAHDGDKDMHLGLGGHIVIFPAACWTGNGGGGGGSVPASRRRRLSLLIPQKRSSKSPPRATPYRKSFPGPRPSRPKYR